MAMVRRLFSMIQLPGSANSTVLPPAHESHRAHNFVHLLCNFSFVFHTLWRIGSIIMLTSSEIWLLFLRWHLKLRTRLAGLIQGANMTSSCWTAMARRDGIWRASCCASAPPSIAAACPPGRLCATDTSRLSDDLASGQLLFRSSVSSGPQPTDWGCRCVALHWVQNVPWHCHRTSPQCDCRLVLLYLLGRSARGLHSVRQPP